MQTEEVVDPTLSSSSRSYSTCDLDFAATMIMEGTLTLAGWDPSLDGRRVEFRFADPEGKGPRLEMEFQNSHALRLFNVRKSLVNKTRDVLRRR
ncbi:MAG: hypothetical protein LAP86_06540 [Acidobacteriia bacterium]|nr:hypothetical protein [Terriglobia bacterium]